MVIINDNRDKDAQICELKAGSIVEYYGRICIATESKADCDYICLVELATGLMRYEECAYWSDLIKDCEITVIRENVNITIGGIQ